jgi:hypothetical protein
MKHWLIAIVIAAAVWLALLPNWDHTNQLNHLNWHSGWYYVARSDAPGRFWWSTLTAGAFVLAGSGGLGLLLRREKRQHERRRQQEHNQVYRRHGNL